MALSKIRLDDRSRTVSLAIYALALALGCKGSLSADAQMGAELDGADVDAEARASVGLQEQDRPLSRDEAQRAAALSQVPETIAGPPLLGARHDVKVRSTDGSVACRCVAALLGPPTMSQVNWQGAPPRTNPETQLFLAISPDPDCPGAPKGTQGSSYWGYRISGEDVVVLLEPWRPEPKKAGKPVPPRTIAAIIPKPAAGGQVYLSPVTGGLPFGSPLEGTGTRCALGNPGPQRNVPLSLEELGSSAPIDDSERVAD